MALSAGVPTLMVNTVSVCAVQYPARATVIKCAEERWPIRFSVLVLVGDATLYE